MFGLIDQLKFSHKFAVVAALALPMFGVPTALLVRTDLAAIDMARSEAEGMPRAAGMLRAIQLTQQHRALSAGMLGGATAMEAPRQAKQAEVERALDKVAADSAAWPQIAAQVADVRSRWKSLAAAVAGRSRLWPAKAGARFVRKRSNRLIWPPVFRGDAAPKTGFALLRDIWRRSGERYRRHRSSASAQWCHRTEYCRGFRRRSCA